MMFAICMFTGCSSDDDTPKDIKITSGSIKQELFADQTQSSEGIEFTTTGAWSSSISGVTRANDASWLSIDPSSGDKAGNYTINITLEPNTTGEDRKAEITIVCNGTTIKITVEQKAVTNSGEKPEVNQAKIRTIEYLNGDSSDDYTINFTYDNQDRIIKWEETMDGQVYFTLSAAYASNKIVLESNYHSDKEDSKTLMTATLNSDNYVETINFREERGYRWQEEIQTITYKNGQMVKCIEKEVADSDNELGPDEIYDMTWIDGYMQLLEWSGILERNVMKYNGAANDKTNLDLNWFLCLSEGYAFVAGGNGECHILASQGYCGKRSRNLKTEELVSYSSNGTTIYNYEYTYDNTGYPTQIKQYYVYNGVRQLDGIINIKY